MKIKILGATLKTELEMMTNPDMAKRYEDGIEKAADRIDGSKDKKMGSDGIAEQCQAVIDLFTDIFGEEDTKKVLGETTNVFRCLDAFDELANLYNDQVVPVLDKRVEKYSRTRLNGR